MSRAYVIAALAAAVLVAGIASAAPSEGTDASAVAIRIVVPGQPAVTVAEADTPATARTDAGSYVYPADGSIVRLTSATSTAVRQVGASASAQGVSSMLGLSVFGGEIAVDSVIAKVTAAAGAASQTADTSGSSLTSLTVLGRPVSAVSGTQLQLADWGTLELLTASISAPADGKSRVTSGEIAGMRVRLVLAHGGLPTGSIIEVGVATATAEALDAQPAPPVAPSTVDKAAGTTFRGRPGAAATVIKEPGSSIPGAPRDIVRAPPAGVVPRLSTAGYVFPVYGSTSFGDTFGAARADVAGGWHHGEDIFASEGTPLLAVADGTVFSVGWNEIGGWRIWLRDRLGNEFYYAHLSAYSPLAVDGAQVRAGDVLGFMGRTGDAEASPPHLHFEIHPVSLLGLGYDGAVAPYPYLLAWRRAEDVAFSVGRIYTPQVGADGRPVIGQTTPSGVVLLQAADISRSSGLAPGGPAAALAATGSSGASPLPADTERSGG